MKRIVAIVLLFVGLSLMCSSEVDAAPRGRMRFFGRYLSTPNPYAFGAPTYPSHYGTPHHPPTVEELYPKYYGSFHYRHLDNIGIPSGDIGLRGNGLYISPW